MNVRSKNNLQQVTLKKQQSHAFKKPRPCSSCDGRGWVFARVYTPCQECQGKGLQE